MNDTRTLSRRLAELLGREQHALAEFLIALADFDRERRWIELGYTSCFHYLHRELGLSKGAAFYRKTAAELIQRYPELVEPLRDGRLCLTSVAELAKVIAPENRGEVIPRFFHASKREARAVAAEIRPAEATPNRDVVTRQTTQPMMFPKLAALPSRPEPPGDSIAGQLGHPDEPRGDTVLAPRAVALASRPERAKSDEAEPLTADLRAYMSPSRSASSTSSPRRATRYRTAIPVPVPKPFWRLPSICSSRRTTGGRAS